MEVKYLISRFQPLNYLFLVIYYTDIYPNGVEVNLPLPIDSTGCTYLSGQELEDFIMAHAPYAELRERERIAQIDTTYIDSLILKQ